MPKHASPAFPRATRKPPPLPIEPLKGAILDALAQDPLVVTAPTGSGKSTMVPRWATALGRVLVVEPRRVACRALASRVAQLDGVRLGGAEVGYRVRDEDRARRDTHLTFVTPGVALRMLAQDALADFQVLVLDELHERRLDVDLLLALALARFQGHLVAMSATLDGPRVAEFLRGQHVHAPGRLHPVNVHHAPGHALLPDTRGLDARLATALRRAAQDPGDILVFLPGKAEIAAALSVAQRAGDYDALPLHGGLTLDQQARVFRPTRRRKVILSTNVAETSLTIPGVGVVIDSGLVRRTQYHRGRGFLTLTPVALDAADQRAGRAGRTAPGVCYRLWDRAAQLAARTPPEVARESLVPLLMGAAACDARPEDLRWLDTPPVHAMEAARRDLVELGLLDPDHPTRLTPAGRDAFGLPLDPPLARIVLEARAAGDEDVTAAAVDLVAALGVGRPLFAPPPRAGDPAARRQRGRGRRDEAPPPPDWDDEDPRRHGSDVRALIEAVRGGPGGGGPGVSRWTRAASVAEARAARRRLRRLAGLSGTPPKTSAPHAPPTPNAISQRQLEALHEILLRALPGCAYVPRHRKGRVAWANGGPEVELGRDSAVDQTAAEAVLIVEIRALGAERRLVGTCATPVRRVWLARKGVGRQRVVRVALGSAEHGANTLVARTERVHAGAVLARGEDIPQGEVARQAVARAFADGVLFRGAAEEARARVEAWALTRALAGTLAPGSSAPRGGSGGAGAIGGGQLAAQASTALDRTPQAPSEATLDAWLARRVAELGVESGEDVALLGPRDLTPPPLPEELAAPLAKAFPPTLNLGDGRFRVRYDVARREATLVPLAAPGQKARAFRVRRDFLPHLGGFHVWLEDRGRRTKLR